MLLAAPAAPSGCGPGTGGTGGASGAAGTGARPAVCGDGVAEGGLEELEHCDGVVEGVELCDGPNLGSTRTCQDVLPDDRGRAAVRSELRRLRLVRVSCHLSTARAAPAHWPFTCANCPRPHCVPSRRADIPYRWPLSGSGNWGRWDVSLCCSGHPCRRVAARAVRARCLACAETARRRDGCRTSPDL